MNLSICYMMFLLKKIVNEKFCFVFGNEVNEGIMNNAPKGSLCWVESSNLLLTVDPALRGHWPSMLFANT